ncbi:hypothetical protein BF695P2_00004 [Bacteroides phage BF695P2]|nr:hypothetical protein BF695P2_00004 [Bacteroides phage BF695P2]WAX07192.1 hypothetical protein BF695P3_00005 [Bacteroides phage BF695P3]
MKEEVILMLSELRSQINDTIMRVQKESSAEGNEIVSMLISCDFVNVYDVLGKRTSVFLEYLESMNFIKTVYTRLGFGYTYFRRDPTHKWVEFRIGKGWFCHPALIALFEIYDKGR